MAETTIKHGAELFRFESVQDWRQRGRSEFRGLGGQKWVAIDNEGKPVLTGMFEYEATLYPVTVYAAREE